jgi:FkbH-like protein
VRVAEAVRLVIWDLDETFWKGTLTEGGIREYVTEHHDLVVTLAKRGIISSICSKNDANTVTGILEEHQIRDYFVFPSISWESKGVRVARLVEQFQLRAPTVMFIDDSPNNRAEVESVVPGIQVEDETFISRMLTDPRFKGKDDSSLSRLNQYKLLESRKRDAESFAQGNDEFLRQCDVRVYLDYDVEGQIDRAIELINRTNQLNYTKRRLPEDIEEARRALRAEMEPFSRQAGLVKVVDKYGDYGYVGFFLVESFRTQHVAGASIRTLRHFCFSCRTLGMLVEKWLYDYLGKPELRVVGEVLTDVFQEKKVDWIKLGYGGADEATDTRKEFAEFRIVGGCEANAIGVYLNAHSERVDVQGNFAAGSLFMRVNSALASLSICDRRGALFEKEALELGIPYDLAAKDYFANCPPGTVFIFSFNFDAQARPRYYHKRHGWELIFEPRGTSIVDLFRLDHAAFAEAIRESKALSDTDRKHALAVEGRMRADYTSWIPTEQQRLSAIREVIERVPFGSKMIILSDYHSVRSASGELVRQEHIETLNREIAAIASDYPYVGLIDFAQAIDNPTQIQVGGNHYDRIVYFRMAQLIIAELRNLPTKEEVARLKLAG